jgi:hypothetical protein
MSPDSVQPSYGGHQMGYTKALGATGEPSCCCWPRTIRRSSVRPTTRARSKTFPTTWGFTDGAPYIASGTYGQILEDVSAPTGAYDTDQGSTVSGRVVQTEIKFVF